MTRPSPTPARLWLCATHQKAFQNGGWAWVRAVGPELSGAAGGDRRTTPARAAMAGLLDALKDLTGEIVVHAPSAEAAALAPLFARPPEPVEDDPTLSAQLVAALAGRARLVRLAEPDTPLAFARAWADLGADKAKAAGPFRSAIPKPNLTKVKGL